MISMRPHQQIKDLIRCRPMAPADADPCLAMNAKRAMRLLHRQLVQSSLLQLSSTWACVHQAQVCYLLSLLLRFERFDASTQIGVCGKQSTSMSQSILARSSLPGTTSSIFNGARLKGSVESLSRCERIVERSMDVFEVGRMTGSFISVYTRGSEPGY